MVQKLKDIKPLIIGIGVAGRRHLEAQLNLGNKVGIYSNNPNSTKPFRKQKNVVVFDNLEEGLDWANLVHICTPDDVHTEYVAKALQRKKAVFCEKAFTTNLKDALYLQDLAHKYKTPLIIAQNYRITPTFAETKKRILEGNLGKITRIETTYLHDATEYQQRTPANKNKDFLYIGGSHAIDLACWISNESVISVKAKTTSNSAFPNSYEIVLKFTSGLLGFIKLDASSPGKYNGTDLIVEGEEGKLVSHNKIDKLLFCKKGLLNPQSIELPNNKTLTTTLEVKIMNDYLLDITASHWPLPGVDEAVNTIRVLDTIQKAATSGKNEFVSY